MSITFMRHKLPEIVAKFAASPEHRFYLTGSRYFGTDTTESDWDFFVQDSDEVRKYLHELGFRIESESYSHDPVIVTVYKKDDVHVQVVLNAVAKAKVQTRLSWFFREFKPTKEQARRLWTEAMRLYRDGVDGGTLLKMKSF